MGNITCYYVLVLAKQCHSNANDRLMRIMLATRMHSPCNFYDGSNAKDGGDEDGHGDAHGGNMVMIMWELQCQALQQHHHNLQLFQINPKP